MTPAESSRILVVDDDPAMRHTIRRILSGSYDVKAVATSAAALESFQTGEFQVALIDVQLNEDQDGYSLCQRVNRDNPETDVILMTGSVTNPEEKLFRSLEEGAFYFLFKPFDRRVLRALLERCLRLQAERKAKEEYAEALARDLEKARRFQQSLLPRQPLDHEGWRVEGRGLQCDALGGDFYFALPDRQGRPVVVIADIVGHGVGAAMYAGMLRSTLDAARRRHVSAEDVMQEVRDGIDFLDPPRMATMFYSSLDPQGGMRYVNAGHPAALLARADGKVEPLEATGVLLTTAFADRPQAVSEVRFEPGDRLLAFTDGLIEAKSPDERELGQAAVADSFAGTRGLSASDTLEALLAMLRRHCAGRPLSDDVTLLLVERRG